MLLGCNENCSSAWTILEVVISAVLAAAVGLLLANNLIPGIVTALWIVFGLAVLNLIFLVAGLYTASIVRRTPLRRCLFCGGGAFLAGIIGTIVFALMALAITAFATSVWFFVIVGIGTFFAVFMTIELIRLLSCLIYELGE